MVCLEIYIISLSRCLAGLLQPIMVLISEILRLLKLAVPRGGLGRIDLWEGGIVGYSGDDNEGQNERGEGSQSLNGCAQSRPPAPFIRSLLQILQGCFFRRIDNKIDGNKRNWKATKGPDSARRNENVIHPLIDEMSTKSDVGIGESRRGWRKGIVQNTRVCIHSWREGGDPIFSHYPFIRLLYFYIIVSDSDDVMNISDSPSSDDGRQIDEQQPKQITEDKCSN